MALCIRQCADCPMTVTVLVDFSDKTEGDRDAFANVRRAAVLNCFDRITAEPDNNLDDLALILNVDGADIAVLCAHAKAHVDSSAIELF